MRAIIHSIHSQVPKTIAGLDHPLDAVISLDSHLDVSIGGDDLVYPKELRVIARRTGAHTAIRQILGARPPSRKSLVIAIPELMFARHASDIESSLPRSLSVRDERESIVSVMEFLSESRGIDVFQSPPNSLLNLTSRTERTGRWLLDIDVDYMQEMQAECYTRIINPGPGVLQSMKKVVGFVQRSKPETITFSEAKLSAIKDERSNFSAFMKSIESMGYTIEEGAIASSDAEISKGISVCKEFYRTVSKSLMANHIEEMMNGDFRGFQREEKDAARRFFTSKGYSY
jgi:hypothetical protein